jgi:hypothetical protein
MKKLIIILFFISGVLHGQEKITKNLGDFNVLKTYRGLNVKLVKADAPVIVIEGRKSNDVVVKNVNGILKLSMSLEQTFSAGDVDVTIYYKDKLDIIDANEGSTITSAETITQDRLEIRSQEGAEIVLSVKTSNLEVKAISAGIISLKGYSINQNVNANTGGIYKGESLETDTTIVVASTGAEATVNADKLVDANAKLGATISVTGNPKEVKKKESLSGYVRS